MPRISADYLGEKPYFSSLEELDVWAASTSPKKYTAPLKYHPRSDELGADRHRGKLLVCHDYKGGYTEKPNTMSYTFNFWSSCDTYIYFAHHRITIPPPGWITASHRQGVKMLGTLIFEGGAEPDCLRLLVGKLPKAPSGPAAPQPSTAALPVSAHYARILADLAVKRGFEGYLLNFECPLDGGIEQARALTEWIALLRRELQYAVGPHAEVIWYDSVIVNGQLRWQDRLNSVNLPFFLPSTGFFSNYTWRQDYPSLTAQYFLSLDPLHLGHGSSSHPFQQPSPKSIQDLYIGIDIWGRGSHGGGGFGAFKALSHIAPESLGLSVALFGQAWTWESEQDKPGWNWHQWWNYERKLWAGAQDENEVIHIPEAPRREGEPDCVHGPFVALSKYFPRKSPPDPKGLAFHTTFCPGVGQRWFIDGIQVFGGSPDQVDTAWWTDLALQTSLGDLVWPRPEVTWEGSPPDGAALPKVIPSICMEDAWNGGSSMKLSISAPGAETDDAAFRSIWIPIQQLTIAPEQKYTASIVFKVDQAEELDLDTALSIKTNETVLVSSFSGVEELEHGWNRLTIVVEGPDSSIVSLGLIMSIVAYDPSQPLSASILVGQVNVYSTPQSPKKDTPVVLRASYAAPHDSSTMPIGKLQWDTAYTYPALASLSITSPEDPIPAFPTCTRDEEVEKFMYFHVFAKRFTSPDHVGGPEEEGTIWIGTTGWESEYRCFDLDERVLLPPPAGDELKKTRIYVRGVTDRGKVARWEEAAYVDIL